MANCCCFDMRVVGKSKEAVMRMRKILGLEDDEFFLYRVMDMTQHKKPVKDGEYFRIDYFGDVAWAADRWWIDDPNPDDKTEDGAHYSTLPEICKALGIGVEVWAQEFGMGIQEHCIVNPCGTISVNERYTGLEVEDEEDDTQKLVGGFGDDFLVWSPVGDIMETYGEEDDGENGE